MKADWPGWRSTKVKKAKHRPRVLGLAHELKSALVTYTESGGMGRTVLDQTEAVMAMLENYEICSGLFHGFDHSGWASGAPAERLGLLPGAQEHILKQENGKERYLLSVRYLSKAFALAVPHEDALRIRDEMTFFQAVRSVLVKRVAGDVRPEEEIDHVVRQIISRAVAPEGVIDVFAAAGLQKPDIAILSDEFLAEVRGMPQRNLAVELLQKLLKGELATRRRKKRGTSALICGNAGAGAATLPESRGRGNPGHRGTDTHCEGYARSQPTRRETGSWRGRTGLLRRLGDQRQRSTSVG